LGIIKIMTDPRSSSGTAEAVAYCGWHPEHGYALQTCGHDQQHAASLLMRTDLAGNHGWSVQPLYAALSPTPQTAGGVREAIAEWLLRDRGLKDASIEAIKEYRGETYLKALDDADEILALSPQAQAGETYSGQTATNLGATIEVVGAVSGVAQGSQEPDFKWGVDYGKDLLADLNQLAHASGTTALLRDGLQRAYKEIARLRKDVAQAVEVTPAMLDAGAQAIINDIWHPPQPLSSIPPADAARHRRTALLVLKAALSLPSTQERTP
jgi:hypothetical protein